MKHILILLAILSSCGRIESNMRGPEGSSGTNGTDGSSGKDGTNGTNGSNGTNGTNGKDYQAPASLANYWMLPDGGYLELLQDSDGHIIINGTQRIYTRNTDNSLGLFVALAVGPYTAHNSQIRIEATPTYVALTNNIMFDASPYTQEVGVRKTVTTFSLNSSNKLVIDVIVYGASGLVIEATRKITAQ